MDIIHFTLFSNFFKVKYYPCSNSSMFSVQVQENEKDQNRKKNWIIAASLACKDKHSIQTM